MMLQAAAGTTVGVLAGMASVDLLRQLSDSISITSKTLHAVVLAHHKSSEPMRLAGAALQDTAKRKLLEEGPVAFHTAYGDK